MEGCVAGASRIVHCCSQDLIQTRVPSSPEFWYRLMGGNRDVDLMRGPSHHSRDLSQVFDAPCTEFGIRKQYGIGIALG